MTLGQWLGKWAGQWLGPVEDQPQGSMSGSATMRVTATGSIGAGGVIAADMIGSATFSFSGSITISIPETVTHDSVGGGGGGGDAGTSYALMDHGWVTLTKIVRTWARAHGVDVQQACVVGSHTARADTRTYSVTTIPDAKVQVQSRVSAVTYTNPSTYSGAACVSCGTTRGRTRVQHAGIDRLSADELVVLLGEMDG